MSLQTLFPEYSLISKDSLKTVENLFKLFGDIHNHIYANDGLSSQEAFNEVLKILFIKIEDEKASHKMSKFYITEEEMSDIKNGKVSTFRERIIDLFDKVKEDYSDVFDDTEKINLKLSTLAYLVDKLQYSNLTTSQRDIKGIAFQKFVYSHQRGERGQFFTPDPIVRLCVEFLSPSPDQVILDPACGTGGFLVEASKYIHNKHKEHKTDKFYGIEINSLVGRISKMRMILEDGYNADIICFDSLAPWNILNRELSKHLSSNNGKGFCDIVLTNPPFGSQGKVTNESVLREFSLAYKWRKSSKGQFEITDHLQNGQAPEILFIERCFEFLKDKGYIAIVLPNGDFENSSLDYVRKFIDSKAKILAIISLPSETFIPHGTGVKASVLIAQKLSENELNKEKDKNYKIFFAKINRIGYEGNKNGTVMYKKDENGKFLEDDKGHYIVDEDVAEIIEKYKEFKNGGKIEKKQNIFTISYKELNSRFDVEFYKPEYQKIKERLKGSKKLGELVDIVNSKSLKLKSPDALIKYVELSDVNSIYGEIISCSEMKVHEAPSRASYEIHEGDIITAVAGNSVGTKNHTTALVTKDFEGAICTNGFRILKAKSINPYYLFIFLRSNLFLSQMFSLRTGAAIPSVSDEDLKNILIPVVPLKTQMSIEKKVREILDLRQKTMKLHEELLVIFNETL